MTTQNDRIGALDEFTRAYIEAMLWSSCDDHDEPLDATYGLWDLSDEALDAIEADCKQFQAEQGHLLTDEFMLRKPGQYSVNEMAGQDFWFTRVGHGTGFWDDNWEDSAGKALTEASKQFGELWPYVGDDGKIYF